MHFSWTVFSVVFVLNLLWIGVMYWAQQCDSRMPARYSIIPGTRQSFNHMQDFYTCSIGDIIGLPLILNAFGHLVVNGHIGPVQWITFVLFATFLGYRFLVMCLSKTHKPDQGYPKVGMVSFHGILHLPHFGVSVAAAMISIVHIVLGHVRGPVLYLFILGVALWLTTFMLDKVTGNFDPLKKE